MKKDSPLEDAFFNLWTMLGGAPLMREYRFAPPRRWRADFAHLPSRTLIEIEGGIWRGGRHITPTGFIADCDKYNAATLLGWRVLRLTPKHITAAYIQSLIQQL